MSRPDCSTLTCLIWICLQSKQTFPFHTSLSYIYGSVDIIRRPDPSTPAYLIWICLQSELTWCLHICLFYLNLLTKWVDLSTHTCLSYQMDLLAKWVDLSPQYTCLFHGFVDRVSRPYPTRPNCVIDLLAEGVDQTQLYLRIPVANVCHVLLIKWGK